MVEVHRSMVTRDYDNFVARDSFLCYMELWFVDVFFRFRRFDDRLDDRNTWQPSIESTNAKLDYSFPAFSLVRRTGFSAVRQCIARRYVSEESRARNQPRLLR